MAKAALVDPLLTAGEEFVKALDDENVKPTVAFWMARKDPLDWVLVIASPDLDQKGPREAYSQLLRVFELGGMSKYSPLEFTDVVTMPTTRPVITSTRRFVKTPGLSRMWLQGNAINGTLLPDTMVYRMQ